MAVPTRDLLDTSAVVDHDRADLALLPDESAIATVTLLLIAPTATANGLPLFTRNPADFAGLEQIVTVITV